MVLKVKKTRRTSAALQEAMTELKKEDTQKLNANIPKSKMKAFKIKAAQEGTDMTKIILKWIDEYISK